MKGGSMNVAKWMVVVALMATVGFATVVQHVPALPHLTGDEPMPNFKPIPYMGSRALGDTIGTTYYDYQANGSFGMRMEVDDSNFVHVNWMKMNSAQTDRHCGWNAWFGAGAWYGYVQASPSWSGYVQLDVTEDNRTMIAYHYNDGTNYQSWLDIDDGQCWGSFGSNMGSPGASGEQHLWPYIVVKGNNVVMVCGDNEPQNDPHHHKYFSTDLGQNWSYVKQYDSCTCISQFLRASEVSNKVVHAWTQSIAMDYAGYLISQTACDVKYQLSTDGGVNWSAPIDITNFQPPGTMVQGDTSPAAYCEPSAIFDESDNLHIVFGVNMMWVQSGTLYYNDRSKIFHWDEVSGNITTVNSPSTYYSEPGGWWLDTGPGSPSGASGAWRMACDHPQLVVDATNHYLVCLWSGQDDTTDVAGSGYFNNEIYRSYSTDNGATWCDYLNLTNTRTPGGGAGACMDEDYFTAVPTDINGDIFITYIEDKDAGGSPHGEGTYTDNPVRAYLFTSPGVAESGSGSIKTTTLSFAPNPATRVTTLSYALAQAGNVDVDLYDASGRLVKNLDRGYRATGTYSLNIDTNGLSNGTYFVVLDTPTERYTGTFVIVH
jgi:hypothetical protein